MNPPSESSTTPSAASADEPATASPTVEERLTALEQSFDELLLILAGHSPPHDTEFANSHEGRAHSHRIFRVIDESQRRRLHARRRR